MYNKQQRYPKCSCNNIYAICAYNENECPTKCDSCALTEAKSNNIKMINVVESKCITCNLYYLYLDNNNKCETCNEHTLNRMMRYKEKSVGDYFNTKGITFSTENKTITPECNPKTRPDYFIDLLTFGIIIEVDENQHKSYDCECELVRMINIHEAYGNKLIFIRFNPDKYKNNKNEIIDLPKGKYKKLLEIYRSLTLYMNQRINYL